MLLLPTGRDRHPDPGLRPLDPSLPAFHLNGPRPWTGRDLTDDAVPAGELVGTPGRLRVPVWTDEVEPQDCWLAFDALPDEVGCVAIQRALRGALRRGTTWG